ncbi:cellobiose phosphorylase [bacterium]|nr:MAG: cellobiose phosphorylase [bacterium]
MIYKFIDDNGTFTVENPHKYNLYFPLTSKDGALLSSISPNLAGDIKRDNEHFLTPPASIEDIRSNWLTRRDFFIRTDSETIRLSAPYQDTLEAGLLYHKIIKKTKRLEIEILNFIPYDAAVELMQIKVKNIGQKRINIRPTSFIPLYGRPEKSLRDHRHVTSLLNRVYFHKFGILLKPTMVFDERGHRVNETTYFGLGLEGDGSAPVGQFPTLDYFYGEGNIISPDAIEKNIKPANKKLPEFDGKEACAALRFKEKRLEKGETASYCLMLGLEESEQRIEEIFQKFNSPAKVLNSFIETKQYWRTYLSGIDFKFGNRNFDNWLLWVKLQPALRKLFGCSFLPHFDYGKGGRGWRDLWQDALTLLLTEPHTARNFIINNFKGVRIDGSNATIIAKDGTFLSDRNRISRVWMDHGIWPYLTLRLYIHKTGDLDILLKEDTYFQDHQFKRAREIDYAFAHQQGYSLKDKEGRVYQGSILEHILAENLAQFFNVGSHNIIRLEHADWNDGLDMAPEHGESATFSFMYAYNLRDLCDFLNRLKIRTQTVSISKELAYLIDAAQNQKNYADYRYKQSRLDEYLTRVKNISGEKSRIHLEDLIADLKVKSDHLFKLLAKQEWLPCGFFNGYYDNQGRRVEGKTPEGKLNMLLPSQVFAIMSGGAAEGQIKKIWQSINKYLRDKKLGGFRLNTNFNSHYNLDLGRAFGFSYGDKENGAFFSHMVVMLANALYQRGFIEEGFEAINSLYEMAAGPKAKIYPLIPEYFNNEGRGLYSYLTGSSSWYIYTLLEEILGVKFVLGDIHLRPKLTAGNFFGREISVQFQLGGNKIHLTYIRVAARKKAYKIKEVYLGDKKIPPQQNIHIVKKEAISGKENHLRVYLK